MKQTIIGLGLVLSFIMPATANAVTWGDFLRGHWMTDCKRGTTGRYTQTGYTFSDFVGPEFRIVLQGTAQYYDSKCTKIYSYHQNLGTLVLSSVLGNSVPLDAPKNGVKIRWQIDPIMQFPFANYDKKGVKELNEKSYCGQSDWQVGKAKDLLKTTCEKEIREFYAKNIFFLEVVDKDIIRLMDKAGDKEEIRRHVFSMP